MSSKFEERSDLEKKKKNAASVLIFIVINRRSNVSRKIYTNDNLINPHDFLDIHISI